MFITFWKLANDVKSSKVAEVAKKLVEEGEYPVEGIKMHKWLMCPGGKGILISEANSIEAAFKSWLRWIEKYPGIFEYHEVHPAMEATKVIDLATSM